VRLELCLKGLRIGCCRVISETLKYEYCLFETLEYESSHRVLDTKDTEGWPFERLWGILAVSIVLAHAHGRYRKPSTLRLRVGGPHVTKFWLLTRRNACMGDSCTPAGHALPWMPSSPQLLRPSMLQALSVATTVLHVFQSMFVLLYFIPCILFHSSH
jgi:hypothetical protein